MTAKTMAEVLAWHRLDAVTYLVSQEEYLCICGKRSDNHEEHQSRELSAAGYGLVADAWDEGQKSGMRHADRVIAAHKIGRPELPGPPSPNPYRKASNDDH